MPLMVFGAGTEDPELWSFPDLKCATVIGKGPSESKSFKRTPVGLNEIELSFATELVSAMACGGVLAMVVSTERERELSLSEPSLFGLPAKS